MAARFKFIADGPLNGSRHGGTRPTAIRAVPIPSCATDKDPNFPRTPFLDWTEGCGRDPGVIKQLQAAGLSLVFRFPIVSELPTIHPESRFLFPDSSSAQSDIPSTIFPGKPQIWPFLIPLAINRESVPFIGGLTERTVYETGTWEEAGEQPSYGLADNCRRDYSPGSQRRGVQQVRGTRVSHYKGTAAQTVVRILCEKGPGQ